MKKIAVLLLPFLVFSCSEETSKEQVKEEIVEKVKEVVPSVEKVTETISNVTDSVTQVAENVMSDRKTISEKVEKKIEAVAEEKMEPIKEAVSEKVKDVVADIVPETSEKVVEEKVELPEVESFSHLALDALLKKHVSSSGNVNYAGLKAQKGKLDAYVSNLKSQGIDSEWSRNEKLAYYINAYNAYTLQLILNNYPTKSIMDINNGKAWDLQIVDLGGEKMSLNHLENKIIRPVFKEPRIHFAVNCAAISCPKLMNGAFLPNQLNSQLEKQTKAFINNTKENQISESEVKLSQIFEWYAVDFGDIKSYVNKYSNTKAGSSAKVSYNQYKWELNGK